LVTELRKKEKSQLLSKAVCFIPFFVLLFFLILSQNYFGLSQQALNFENPVFCEIGVEKSVSGIYGTCGKYFGCGIEVKRNSQYCKEIYYTATAKKNSDVSYCEKIDYANSRLGCIYEVALETKNPETCQKIAANPSDEFYRNTLGSHISTEQCFTDVAVASGDEKTCEKLPIEKKAIDSCINTVQLANIITEAIQKEDQSICNKMGDRFAYYYFNGYDLTKDDCYDAVQYTIVTKEAIQKKDPSVCKKLEVYPPIGNCEDAVKASTQ
jgi:hypothetical protein